MDYGELDSEMQKTLEKHLDLLVVTGGCIGRLVSS